MTNNWGHSPHRRPVTRSLPTMGGSNRKILQIFWIIAFSLCSWILFFSPNADLLSIGGALAIVVASLLPVYLWCSERAKGRPIFPLFAITFIWTYAFPLLSNTPGMAPYTPDQRLFAGITTAGFLAFATFIWFLFVQSDPAPPVSYQVLAGRKGDKFFLIVLAIGTLFSLNNNSRWVDLGNLFTLIRSTILALNLLATFTLSYRLGTKELNKKQKRYFLFLLVLLMISDTVGLLLISAISIFVVAISGFVIGGKKIPFKTLVIVILLFSFLHYGKAEMRGKYGIGGQQVQMWEYPGWYSEWVGYSLDYLTKKSPNSSSSKVEEKQSFLERSSLVQLLLLSQTQSPKLVPYLNGATYAILPQLLMPRFLNSSKIRSHEGTYILNIHYGKQTREQTLTTTIGWGLLAESYANFGLFGFGGLAIVLGSWYGLTTRWCINAPLLSDRSLLTIIVLGYSFQTEFSAGVYVAALFQSLTVLAGISIFLMKPSPSRYYARQ